MSLANNNVSKLFKNMEKSYSKHLIKNQPVSYVLIAIIVLYIIGVSFMPLEALEVFDNMIFRVVCVVVICLLCLVDPVKAILLAIAFVVSIQKVKELKKKDNKALNNINLDSLIDKSDELNAINNVVTDNMNMNQSQVIHINQLNNTISNAINETVNNKIEEIKSEDGNMSNLNKVKNEVINAVENTVENVLNNINKPVVDNKDNRVNLNKVGNIVNNVVQNSIEQVSNQIENKGVVNVELNTMNKVIANAVVNSVNNSIVENEKNNNILDDEINNEDEDEDEDVAVDVNNNSNANNENKNKLLKNTNNIKTDVVNSNSRDVRRNYNVMGYNSSDVSYKHPENEDRNLLLGDISGYKVDNRNMLSGDYDNSVSGFNNNQLIDTHKYNNVRNNKNNKNNKNTLVDKLMDNVSAYNNNLVGSNPFPGNNLDLVPEFVPANNNVNSYNEQALQYNRVNNVGEVLMEGFESNTSNDVEELKKSINNAINNFIDKLDGGVSSKKIKKSLKEVAVNEINNNNVVDLDEIENAVEDAVENAVNDVVNNIANSNNQYVDPNDIKNKVKDALNNAVDNSVNNAVKSNGNNENIVPKNPLFYDNKNNTNNRLNKIQSRKVRVKNNANRNEMVSGPNMFSAQGYNTGSNITGFNESGATAINYLCVSKNNECM